MKSALRPISAVTPSVAFAEAHGLKAWGVDDPADVGAALKQAIAHDGPTLVDLIAQPLEEFAVPVSRSMD